MTIAEKTTHVTEALSWLIEQFKEADDFKAWLSVYLTQVQELEAVLFDILAIPLIDTSSDAQLDLIGRILGVERLGESDVTYRMLLKTKIMINKSSGTPTDIIDIVDFLISNDFELKEWYPAAMSIIISDDFSGDISTLANVVRSARAAGVGCDIEYTLDDDDYTFTFASGDSAEADSNRGFSNDGGTSGGKFADAKGA